MAVRSFEDLDRWESSRELRRFIHKNVLPKLPSEERYRPNDQLVRGRSTSEISPRFLGGVITWVMPSSYATALSLSECRDYLITVTDECLILVAGMSSDQFLKRRTK